MNALIAARKSGRSSSHTGEKLGLRESGKLEKAARIKLAARELFHELGFEATTVQAVAERARIGKGTLFSYASVKEDLLIIVFMDELMEVVAAGRRRALRSGDLVDRLHRLYGSMLDHHHKTASLSRHLVREIAYIDSPRMRANIAPLVQFNREAAADFISSEQSRGAFKADVDAGLLADNCFSIFYNVLNRMLTERVTIEDSRKLLRIRLDLQIKPYRIAVRR